MKYVKFYEIDKNHYWLGYVDPGSYLQSERNDMFVIRRTFKLFFFERWACWGRGYDKEPNLPGLESKHVFGSKKGVFEYASAVAKSLYGYTTVPEHLECMI